MYQQTSVSLKDLSLSTLFQAVQIYERRMIDGCASEVEIDRYVQCQLELAERLAYRYSDIDPRD